MGAARCLWHRPAGGFAWRVMEQFSPKGTKWDYGPFVPRPSGWQPWLVPCTREFVNYGVLSERYLLRDMDALAREPSQDAILSFANRYGALDGDFPCFPPRGGPVQSGEPLGYWQIELKRFKEWRALWALIRRREAAALAQIIGWDADGSPRYRGRVLAHRSLRYYGREALAARTVTGTDAVPREIRALAEDLGPQAGVLGVARWVLDEAISSRLWYAVHLRMQPFGKGELRFVPVTLIGAVYLLFAFEVSGARQAQRTCAFARCQVPFAPRRRDQRYCTSECRWGAKDARRRR